MVWTCLKCIKFHQDHSNSSVSLDLNSQFDRVLYIEGTCPKGCTSNRHACHRCSLCQLLWFQSIHQVQFKIFNWAAICRSNLKTLMNTRKASISQLLPRRLLPFLGVAGRLKIHHILYGSTILVAGDPSRLQKHTRSNGSHGPLCDYLWVAQVAHHGSPDILLKSKYCNYICSCPDLMVPAKHDWDWLLAAVQPAGSMDHWGVNFPKSITIWKVVIGCYRLFLFSRMKMARGCKGAK